MLGHVQLFLQLGIDRFADQTQAIELLLIKLRPLWGLGAFGRSQQVQRALKSRVILSSIAKQSL
ncbi:MAG: hypothetical protein NVSMB27_23820 [Ktedonobacteraceae bacterium]